MKGRSRRRTRAQGTESRPVRRMPRQQQQQRLEANHARRPRALCLVDGEAVARPRARREQYRHRLMETLTCRHRLAPAIAAQLRARHLRLARTGILRCLLRESSRIALRHAQRHAVAAARSSEAQRGITMP